jgi:tetratricopeptide (TPR) repeat protein
LACNNLANALLDNGHPAEAIALYSQVLAREPSYWLSNYNLGYSYYKIGYLQAAELYLRRAIGISDVDSDQYVYLGLTLWRQGQLDEAAQYVQRAIQIRPSAPGYHFVLGVIRQDQKNLAAAESEFALELKYQPESNAARQRLTAIRTAGAGHPDKRK